MKKKLSRWTAVFTVMLLCMGLCLGLPVSAAYENTHVNSGNPRVDIVEIAKTQIGYLEGSLEDILKRFLGLEKVRLIPCGGGSPIDAQREQWNDGSNTLALAPGEIIVYDRNRVTNRLFEEVGLTLHKLPSSEISRGRGGPHCMSMPFYRDFLD